MFNCISVNKVTCRGVFFSLVIIKDDANGCVMRGAQIVEESTKRQQRKRMDI